MHDRADVVLNARLGDHIEPGPESLRFPRLASDFAAAPMVGGFYLLLSYTDVLVLQQFRVLRKKSAFISPGEDIGARLSLFTTARLSVRRRRNAVGAHSRALR